MILLLSDLAGVEHRVGVADGRFVAPEAASGPTRDFRRLYAISGLADSHAHLSGDSVEDMLEPVGVGLADKMRRNAAAQLEGGILLLAEKGSRTSLSLRFLDEEAASRPQLQMAGKMIAVREGYYPGFAAEVGNTNLVEIITAAATDGATWVKIVGDWPRRGQGALPNFSADELRTVVSVAHDAGCRVAIHTTAPGTPETAVRAGVDSIEHGLFLTPADLEVLGARGGAWVPTVLAMESIAAWLGSGSSGGRMIAAGLDNVAGLLGFAVDAGVAVLAGTDVAVPHGGVAQEAVRLTHYGLSNRQAVDAVSGAAYGYLGVASGFVAGNSADVVLFAANPYEDPTELQRPAHVMRAGRVVVGSF